MNPPSAKGNSGFKVKLHRKRRTVLGLWALWIAYLSLTYEVGPVSGSPALERAKRVPVSQGQQLEAAAQAGPRVLADLPGNCTDPSILEFPPDLFTQQERQSGAVVIHFLASVYVFYSIAIICDDYFVPSIERICVETNLPTDVAGATIMAVATSSPELFTNIIGTFITEGDIGVGTIVGSAVFNILAVCACCGFAASEALHLDWYPLTRDCIFYSISVVLLIIVIRNRQVFWYEALILVIGYIIYIFAMSKNTALKRFMEGTVEKIQGLCKCCPTKSASKDEKTPLLKDGPSPKLEKSLHQDDPFQNGEETDEERYGVWSFPRGESCWTKTEWILGWPARLVFTLTVPDCQKPSSRSYYPFTFFMCIVHIGFLSYIAAWLVTVIGHTIGIPDSVMGLTFITYGASVPEAVASINVAKKGLGSMAISNSIGSNTFDVLICLGLPWLIKAAIVANDPEDNFVQINSSGLEYSITMLFMCLLLFYGMLAANGFYLDKKVATVAALLYAVFLVSASLLEMNVFLQVNLPTCNID